MGMTILQAQQRLHEKWMELTKDGKDEEMMQALSIADTVLGNYDESLKADMVAMLTEILTDFDNQIEPNSTRIDCESIIEQKIQVLEGKTDGEK
jgi:hypothetical protein